MSWENDLVYGQVALLNGGYSEAEKRFRSALDKANCNQDLAAFLPKTSALLAEALIKMGKGEEAEEMLLRSEKLAEDERRAQEIDGGADKARQESDYEAWRFYCERVDYWLRIFNDAEHAYESASEALRIAMRIFSYADKNLAETFRLAGRVLFMIGHRDAEAFFRAAGRITYIAFGEMSKEWAEAQLNLAKVLMFEERFEEAIICFESAFTVMRALAGYVPDEYWLPEEEYCRLVGDVNCKEKSREKLLKANEAVQEDRLSEARQYLAEAERILADRYGEDDPAFLDIWIGYIKFFARLGWKAALRRARKQKRKIEIVQQRAGVELTLLDLELAELAA